MHDHMCVLYSLCLITCVYYTHYPPHHLPPPPLTSPPTPSPPHTPPHTTPHTSPPLTPTPIRDHTRHSCTHTLIHCTLYTIHYTLTIRIISKGGHPAAGFDPTKLPAVHSVHARNISGSVNITVAELKGLKQPKDSATAMTNITFENVHITGIVYYTVLCTYSVPTLCMLIHYTHTLYSVCTLYLLYIGGHPYPLKWICSNVWGSAADSPGACECLSKGCL
jgi:hypothetical protein